MNTHQIAAQIARRLPDLRKRDVQDVLEILTELWHVELAKPDGEIHISGLGTLYVETHRVRCTGVIRQTLRAKYGANAPTTLERRSIRFRPYEALRNAIKEEHNNHE